MREPRPEPERPADPPPLASRSLPQIANPINASAAAHRNRFIALSFLEELLSTPPSHSGAPASVTKNKYGDENPLPVVPLGAWRSEIPRSRSRKRKYGIMVDSC
jgi:hypothetical protein